MTPEETIQKDLISLFPELAEKVRIPRKRRLWADVPQGRFREVFEHAFAKLGFTSLCTITGLDDGERLSAIYHLAHSTGIVLSLKTDAPKTEPVLKTVTDLFPSATMYERELEDLLGFKVQGLAPGAHYPLWEGWPKGQYPLRKDWNAEMLDAVVPKGQEKSNG